jgi:hypothetical protein
MAAEDHDGGGSPTVNPTKVDHSVDVLAKELASGTVSRRKVLRMLGAALVGGVLASVPRVAWARVFPCPQGTRRCPDDTCVPVGQTCRSAGCPTGQVRCRGICTNLQTDPLNCSACGAACPPGAFCQDSFCHCPPGQELCGFDIEKCVSSTCSEGQFFNRFSCRCEEVGECSGGQDPCDFAFPCGSSEFGTCNCFITAAGPHRCFGESDCGLGSPCVNDSDCPSGFACAVNCCGSQCWPLCGTPPTTSSLSQDLQGTGVRSG